MTGFFEEKKIFSYQFFFDDFTIIDFVDFVLEYLKFWINYPFKRNYCFLFCEDK